MALYRKKPVVIEAVQWVGLNCGEVAEFLGHSATPMPMQPFAIETIDGTMVAQPLDWIIKGVAGEFYPCKPEIFEQTYEAVS